MKKDKTRAAKKESAVKKEKVKAAAVTKKEKPVKAKSQADQKKEAAAVRAKRRAQRTEASPVKSKVKDKKETESRPPLLRLRERLEASRMNDTSKEEKLSRPSSEPTKIRTKPAAEKKKPQAEDKTTEKKKTAQRFFQCVYFPGKGSSYPLRPAAPPMSPAMLPPAVRSMLEQQQRASRAPGQ